VRLVMDNLNTHSTTSLYETFPPEEARRLTERLEIHYTPKHGSWLNIAEIELSVLNGQCLDRRIPDMHTIKQPLGKMTETIGNRRSYGSSRRRMPGSNSKSFIRNFESNGLNSPFGFNPLKLKFSLTISQYHRISKYFTLVCN
jgi:hypothetical protein